MNLAPKAVNAEILLVSQFTLYADISKRAGLHGSRRRQNGREALRGACLGSEAEGFS